MSGWGGWFEGGMNWITIGLIALVLASVVQGYLRGASGSAQSFLSFGAEGALTVLSALAAWRLGAWLSPLLRDWLIARNIVIPSVGDLGFFRQAYYTFVTGVRDFPLLRGGVLFLIGYAAIKQLLYWGWRELVHAAGWFRGRPQQPADGRRTLWSSGIGGGIGVLLGTGRALLVIAALFVFTSLFPSSQFSRYVQSSGIYTTGASQVIAPFSGDFLQKQLPVLTQAVEQEYKKILQRKYEVLDAKIPADIAEAAKAVVEGKASDEAKARALYQWVGTRVRYDWDKVEQYETRGIWKEQTPEDTFATKLGVCIDYSRLYSVMARAVGLEVKVVTGRGYDGRGSYGPHAWNEVYLRERAEWVPLDSTWVSSGGNWFDTPNFEDTHIRDV
ncbi:transglutaminase domain-containing protein [Paenibacillus koleovorans]|uniref:transglutaminase domain-containing protein n=1 Tax=Paenibacillus koleovorans TaxID=121608 RepID=UPI000FDBE8BE|nr:transglutaminase domain-containing protein [Paenibacillus koleovorans]